MASVTPQGIPVSNRVDPITYQKINTKVVDNILNSVTFASRTIGLGKPFIGKTMDYPIKVIYSNQGEWFTGLETLSSAATDTLVTLSFAHTAFQQPQVSIMLESFANAGPTGVINLDEYKFEESRAEALQSWGQAIYQNAIGSQMLGLAGIVDDGTNASTIGGQSRSTYTTLKAYVAAASGGVWSLNVAATLYDNIIAAGIESEEPNLGLTTKTVWSLHEQLLNPQVRNDYNSSDTRLPLRGTEPVPAGSLRGMAGFRAISYRGIPIIRDDAASVNASGTMFFLNENYFGWKGRVTVPEDYQEPISRLSFGDDMRTLTGVAANEPNPPSSVGWFHQDPLMLPQQAGKLGRIYAIGQMCVEQPRRNGKVTGITTV